MIEFIFVITILIAIGASYAFICNMKIRIESKEKYREYKDDVTIFLTLICSIVALFIMFPYCNFDASRCSEGRFGENDVDSCIEHYQNDHK